MVFANVSLNTVAIISENRLAFNPSGNNVMKRPWRIKA